jgi:hypothetical protein
MSHCQTWFELPSIWARFLIMVFKSSPPDDRLRGFLVAASAETILGIREFCECLGIASPDDLDRCTRLKLELVVLVLPDPGRRMGSLEDLVSPLPDIAPCVLGTLLDGLYAVLSPSMEGFGSIARVTAPHLSERSLLD